jgi:hypothetical protein
MKGRNGLGASFEFKDVLCMDKTQLTMPGLATIFLFVILTRIAAYYYPVLILMLRYT